MRALVIGLMLATAGCAGWSGRDQARLESEARADDARCTSATVRFPSDSYLDCRRRLAEQRQDKRKRELEMAALHSENRSPEAAPRAEGVYRPIDPERFRCESRGEGEARLVMCAEE